MREYAIYLKADRNSLVRHKAVVLSDVAKIYSSNTMVAEEVKKLVLFHIKGDKKKNYVFSILKVIEIIQKEYPNTLICNVGEPDFIVEYAPPKKENKLWEYVKVVMVCAIVFFGSAFTIMTFNEDASVESVFQRIYKYVLGSSYNDSYILEISYAIGLPIGTIVFFNHFLKGTVTKDPTPLQIQMRLHEVDIDTTLIENADREGTEKDVD